MNKINFIIHTVIIIAVLYLFYHRNQKQTIIDNQKLLSNYEGVKKPMAEFQQKNMAWNANIDTLQNRLKEAINNYNKNIPKWTEKERLKAEERLNEQRRKFMEYQKAIQKKAAEEDQRLMKEVKKDIDRYIKQYAEENDIDLILGATGNGTIVYMNKETMDITDELIEYINAKYKGTK